MAEFGTSMQFDSAWLAPSGVLDDRYEIRRVLGHGGAAVVLLALDRRYDREVAIKVLKPELAGVVASERFLQEVRITASLQHPHILPLLDSGESRGLPYYITPYVSGGSLRDRLQEARQLPLDEVLGITADVAAALQCAHEHQILHRDIKPENILLANGHAIVADFGLAQALVRAGGDRLTSSGIVVGTPAYISPEQASGERALGPTTDVYSLACVVYEMIAGVPPFVGPTAESVIAQRFRSTPHPLRDYRPTVPAALDSAVSRAMCSAPADRFQSAREFAAAMGVARGSGDHPSTVREAGKPSRSVFALRVGTAAVIFALALIGTVLARRAIGARTLDAARYVVFPAAGDGGNGLTPAIAARRMASALKYWQGIRVFELTSGPASADSSSKLASDVASRRGAGNYLTTTLRSLGDSTEISAALWRTSTDSAPLGERTIRVRNENALTDAPWRRLTASLLAGTSDVDADDARGTTSLDAWRAYARGQAARNRWDLAQADSSFRAAVAADPRFAQAQLWLGQVNAWAHPDRAQLWHDDGVRALALGENLTRRDSMHARALAALGAGDFPAACAAYRALLDLRRDDPIPWLGIGQCEAVDDLVERDARSPSGWRFRTSWWSAAAAYDSAIHRSTGAPAFAYSMLRALLLTDPRWSREGHSADSSMFAAYPRLDYDTISFIPYPMSEIEAGALRADRSTIATALRRNAQQLELTFADWTRRAPSSADAWEQLAFAQEQTGEAAAEEGGGLLALGTIARARRLAKDSIQQLRLATASVRLLVKTGSFAGANRLADSLLRVIPRANGEEAVLLSGVAALVGRVERTTELLRVEARVAPEDVFQGPAPPPEISDAALSYLALAGAGVCSDQLRAARDRVEDAVRRYATGTQQAQIRASVIARATSLAVPCLGLHAIDSVDSRDPLVRMQHAAASRDYGTVRATMHTIDQARRYMRPGDASLDHVYQEAWLLAAVGDTTGAIDRLDLSLSSLTTINTRLLEDTPVAAALGRTMMLRADLAFARQDAQTAKRWAADMLALCSGSSPALGTDMDRMKKYASTHP